MLILVIRGVILISLLSWYSLAVWRMIDGYFKEQFQAYLQEEYRRNPRMRSDVENPVVRSVDKMPVVTGSVCYLPTELSRVAEPYDLDDNDVCPADIVDNYCLPCTIHDDDKKASREPMKEVTGGTSDNMAVSTTDKNAFLENGTRPSLKSRKPSIDSNTHNDEWRTSVINQEGDYREQKKKVEEEEQKKEEESTEGREISDGVLLVSSVIIQRSEKSRYWVDVGAFGRSDASKTFSETLSEKQIIKKRRVNTIAFKDIDYPGVSMGRQEEDNDFLEFEDEDAKKEEKRMSQKNPDEGILVSELPFKPEVDIDDLNRITAEEFCPLTLEDDSSCGETITWP